MNRWNLVLAVGLMLHAGAALAADKYALLVGVANYQHPELRKPEPLKFTVNDVNELAKLLRPVGYRVTLLTDETATQDEKLRPTKSNVEAQLKAMLRQAKAGDSVLVAFTGHGLQFGQEAYYCPVDARPFADETDSLVSISLVYGQLEKSFADVKVLLVDACRNDPTPGRGRGPGISDVAPPKGVAALFSCSRGQRSFEHDSLRHGVFFHYVLEGLKHEAADRQGDVTFEGLSTYVRKMVPAKVHELFPDQKPNQLPNMKADLEGAPPVLARVEFGPTIDKMLGTRPGEERADNGLQMVMCWIPPGQFKMGSPASEEGRGEDEQQVDVTISRGFWLGKHEVTQGEWQRLMGSNPSYFSTTGDGKDRVTGEDTSRFPVETVSWDNVQQFCATLTSQDRAAGKLPATWVYRLPTEAEWEYACRAGTTTPFQFGRSLNGGEANCAGNYPYGTMTKGTYIQRTCRVGSYAGNAWGLRDMHGNVWEWCQDSWDGSALLPGGRDPLGKSGEYRVDRGGCWSSYPVVCRSADRSWSTPVSRDFYLGFRLVRGPSSQ